MKIKYCLLTVALLVLCCSCVTKKYELRGNEVIPLQRTRQPLVFEQNIEEPPSPEKEVPKAARLQCAMNSREDRDVERFDITRPVLYAANGVSCLFTKDPPRPLRVRPSRTREGV